MLQDDTNTTGSTLYCVGRQQMRPKYLVAATYVGAQDEIPVL